MESSNQSKDELISSFCGITGVEAPRGQFYLEAANWDLQLAIQSFFEHSAEDIALGSNANPNPNPVVSEEQQTAQQLQQMFGNQPIVSDKHSSDDEMSSPSAPDVSQSSPKSDAKKSKNVSKSQTSSKFATIDSLRAQTHSDSSEEEGQAFYAGGSERSGQQVLGPKKKNSDELVSNMFASAKAHGAEVVDPSAEAKANQPMNTFSGTGFKLGSKSEESTPVQTASTSSVQRRGNREIVLKLWRNGFSLDDGPLRDYNDPQNKEFLGSIHKGEIPRELIQTSGGREVHLNMEDKRNEDFSAPKRKLLPFSGEGRRLGP